MAAVGRPRHLDQARSDNGDLVAATRKLRRLAVDVLCHPPELGVVVVADDRNLHAASDSMARALTEA